MSHSPSRNCLVSNPASLQHLGKSKSQMPLLQSLHRRAIYLTIAPQYNVCSPDKLPRQVQEWFFVVVIALGGYFMILQVLLSMKRHLLELHLSILHIDFIPTKDDGNVLTHPAARIECPFILPVCSISQLPNSAGHTVLEHAAQNARNVRPYSQELKVTWQPVICPMWQGFKVPPSLEAKTHWVCVTKDEVSTFISLTCWGLWRLEKTHTHKQSCMVDLARQITIWDTSSVSWTTGGSA